MLSGDLRMLTLAFYTCEYLYLVLGSDWSALRDPELGRRSSITPLVCICPQFSVCKTDGYGPRYLSLLGLGAIQLGCTREKPMGGIFILDAMGRPREYCVNKHS